MRKLAVAPLTKAAFAPFGEVIETTGVTALSINQGFAERFHDLARIDTGLDGGETILSLFRGNPRPLPVEIRLMERHPLGSQAFVPLQDRDWLVVVAEGAPENLRAFRASGRQGVNYQRNIWHHPLLVLDPDSAFLIVDRKGPGNNLEEAHLSSPDMAALL